MEADEFESAAQNYTIAQRRMIGSKVIVSVIMNGELIEFEKEITERDARNN